MAEPLTDEEAAELAKAQARRASAAGTISWAEAKRRLDAEPLTADELADLRRRSYEPLAPTHGGE